MSLLTVGSAGVRLVPVTDTFSTEARAKLRDLRVDVAVNANLDTAEATARLEEFTRPRDMTVNVNADTTAAVAQLEAAKVASNDAGAGFSGLLTAAVALTPALVPITAAVAGLGVALAAPLAAAAGGAGLFAFIAGAQIVQIGKTEKAITSLNQKIAATKSPKELAAYRAELAGLQAQLAGAPQQFIAAKGALEGAFAAFTKTNGATILGPLAQGMNLLAGILPSLTPLVTAASGALSGLVTQIGGGLQGGGFQSFVKTLSGLAGPALANVGTILINIARGFASLSTAAGPLGGGILANIAGASGALANFGQSQGFQKFLGYVQLVGPQVLTLFSNLWQIAVKLVAGMAPIGGVVLAAIGGIASVLAKLSPTALGAIVTGILGIVAGVKIWAAAQALLDIALDANPIGIIIVAVTALVAGVIYAYTHFAAFREIVAGVWTYIKTVFSWSPLGLVIEHWRPIVTWFSNLWTSIRDFFVGGWNDIGAFFASIPGKILGFLASIPTLLGNLGHALIQGFEWAIAAELFVLYEIFIALPNKIIAFFVGAPAWLVTHGAALIRGLLNGITTGYAAVSAWFGALPGRVAAFTAAAGTWLLAHGAEVLRGLATGFENGWSAVSSFLGGLPGRVASFTVSAGQWLYQAGKEILSGLANGIRDSIGTVTSAIGNVASGITSKFKSLLGIASPSKLFASFGQFLVQGLVLGIDGASSLATAAAGRIPDALVKGLDASRVNLTTSTALTAVRGSSGPLDLTQDTVDRMAAANLAGANALANGAVNRQARGSAIAARARGLQSIAAGV